MNNATPHRCGQAPAGILVHQPVQDPFPTNGRAGGQNQSVTNETSHTAGYQ
jgi:hypothetical protein